MEEIKVKFSIQNQELIRQGLAGVYFLIKDENIVFIGENKDISRQIAKHKKKGPQFDTIGVTPLEDARQRRSTTHALIDKYRPMFNKIKGRKAAPPKIAEPKQEKRRPKRKPRGKPAKEISVPQNRIEMAKTDSQNGSVQLSEPTAAMVHWLTEQGLGTRWEIVQQAIKWYYQERRDISQDALPAQTTQEAEQPKDNGIISDTARDALIAWTQKLNQEAYSEMEVDHSDTQTETKEQIQEAIHSAYAKQVNNANHKEAEVNDFPEWLTNLADETLFGDIAFELNNNEGSNLQEAPQHTPDATLPDWALDSSHTSQESVPTVTSIRRGEADLGAGSVSASTPTPVEDNTNPNPSEEDEEIPEWMSDIDMSKSRGNSVSPFS